MLWTIARSEAPSLRCVGCGGKWGAGTIWGRIRLPEMGAERVICLGCYTNPELDLTAALAGEVASEVAHD